MTKRLLPGKKVVAPPAKALPVKVLTFNDITIRDLRKWLGPPRIKRALTMQEETRISSQIERLRNIAQDEIHEEELTRLKNDSPVDEEKIVLKASEFAVKLLNILDEAPGATFMIFMAALEQQKENVIPLNRLIEDLRTLAKGIPLAMARSKELTKQMSWRSAHPIVIFSIVDVCKESGIEPSLALTGRFFQICEAIFSEIKYAKPLKATQFNRSEIGHITSPKGSILAYQKIIARSQAAPESHESGQVHLRPQLEIAELLIRRNLAILEAAGVVMPNFGCFGNADGFGASDSEVAASDGGAN